MFNESFYPTPVDVIEKMLAPYVETTHTPELNPGDPGSNGRRRPASDLTVLRHARSILEPSAGKGDICDYIKQKYDPYRNNIKIDCVEINPELQATLTGKGYRVLDSDFLTFDEPYQYTMIVMNPPFADGVKHILKAWDVVADGGKVACLLNAETVLNPCTKERELLQHIIEQHGSYENIGAAFKNAERPTNVDVVIVWLDKPEKEKVNFEGVQFETEAAPNEGEFSANPLANKETVVALVDQYNSARQLLQERHDLESKIRFYTRGIRYSVNTSSEGERGDQRSLAEQVQELKQAFWRYVFEKTKVGNITTSQFQKDFEERITSVSNMAFSLQNIYQVMSELFENRESIMERCIIEAFDAATKFHEKNQVHVEGWKTNKAYKLAHRIIYPYGIRYEYGTWGFSYYGYGEFYKDIDKALCFISGKNYEDITSAHEAMQEMFGKINRGEVHYSDEFESTHFKIRMYKKGTVHLTFKDLDLLARFNFAAAQGKKWVGPGKYEDHKAASTNGQSEPATQQLALLGE